MTDMTSYQPNLCDHILVIEPHYKGDVNSIVYTQSYDGSISSHPTYLNTTSFLEHFLYLQGTSILGSRESARNLYNLSKNIPIYAPKTHQVIHKYHMAKAPDPIYFFTMLYHVTAIAKKQCELTLQSLSFIVEASKKQCVSQQQQASLYLLRKSPALYPVYV